MAAVILRRRLTPGRHGDFIGDEEVVHVPRNEACGGRLLADDIDNVVTVPAASLTQEGFLTVIVVRRVIAELPRATAIGEGRIGRRRVPAGKGPRTGFDVIFGVVERFVFADTQGEQFEQFATVVLIQGDLVAFRVIQIIHHPSEGGELHEQVLEVAHAVLPEHGDHPAHFLRRCRFCCAQRRKSCARRASSSPGAGGAY